MRTRFSVIAVIAGTTCVSCRESPAEIVSPPAELDASEFSPFAVRLLVSAIHEPLLLSAGACSADESSSPNPPALLDVATLPRPPPQTIAELAEGRERGPNCRCPSGYPSGLLRPPQISSRAT